MLQAVLHGKSKTKHEEDTLTSSVFGLLVLLPDPVLWEILRRATDGQLPRMAERFRTMPSGRTGIMKEPAIRAL